MAESPFRSFTKSGTAYCGDFDWTTRYMGTEEAKQLAAPLHGTAKLDQELTDVGFITARYLIISDRFEAGSEEDTWKMDAFEVANVTNAEGAGFTVDKAHFSGRYPAYTSWGLKKGTGTFLRRVETGAGAGLQPLPGAALAAAARISEKCLSPF